MRNNIKKSGFILILAISVIAIISVLLVGIIQRVTLFSRLGPTLVRKEQAQLLAQSGIQIACAQLAALENKKTDEQKKGDDQSQRMLGYMKLLNRWQVFNFTPEQEGISGSCSLYMSSEQGKIAVNSLYDFKTKKMVKTAELDAVKLCTLIEEKFGDSLKIEGFAKKIEQFFKERGKPLDDISQLLEETGPFKGKKIPLFATAENSLALSDLFTVEVKQSGLQPLLLSETINTMMGFKKNARDDKALWSPLEAKRRLLTATIDWQKQWNELLAPFYGKEYTGLVPELRSLFVPSFEVKQFLVIATGQVYGITQRCAAIIVKKQEKKQKSSENTQTQSENLVSYCIKKLYWL